MIELLKRPDVRAFIEAHENEDPAALVLKYAKDENLPIQLIAAQIKARQKAKTKLPEFHQTKDIIFPHGVSMEQCSSEATARYKSSIVNGEKLTDLTGGLGIDTYYLSSQFASSHYVEQNAELAQVVKSNFQSLSTDIECHTSSAEEYLSNEGEKSDWYFIDPARRGDSNQKVFRIEDCQPDLNKIVPALLENGSKVLIKLSPLLDIQQALRTLPNVSEVHVVSTQNECKELLFKLEPGFDQVPSIQAANIMADRRDDFTFDYENEKDLPPFELPRQYIYEPNASIMKAGGFNAIANKFNLSKLHANSHLYTSDIKIEGFPGRLFQLTKISSLNKKLLRHLPEKKANITTRNFPLSVKEIRSKAKIKEGGDIYLFATTLIDGSHKILICQPTAS